MNNLRRRVENSSGVVLDHITGRGIVDGYEVVDLGLPSGLLWVTCNVGVSRESGYGNYYQWGSGSSKYVGYNISHSGGTNSSYVLPSSADTATQVWGSKWKMPTYSLCEELINNTYCQVATINGIKGAKYTSKTNPNAYIFIPASGYYDENHKLVNTDLPRIWSSTPESKDYAYFMEYGRLRGSWRPWYEGIPVRAVFKG